MGLPSTLMLVLLNLKQRMKEHINIKAQENLKINTYTNKFFKKTTNKFVGSVLFVNSIMKVVGIFMMAELIMIRF